VRGSDEDVAAIGAQVVDTVGHGNRLGVAAKVMVKDGGRVPHPGGARVLDRPTSSFFLASTLMTGSPAIKEGLAQRLDVLELLVALALVIADPPESFLWLTRSR